MLAVFLSALFGLVLIGVPIAFSRGGTGFFMMLTQALSRPASWSVFALAQRFVNGCDSVPLLAIPFFMIAGEIMTRGGISKRIVDFAYSVLGRFKGGLGYVGILASMIFAGVSGSTVEPDGETVDGFNAYMERYQALLHVECKAVEVL